jgi:hypothetical protein
LSKEWSGEKVSGPEGRSVNGVLRKVKTRPPIPVTIAALAEEPERVVCPEIEHPIAGAEINSLGA